MMQKRICAILAGLLWSMGVIAAAPAQEPAEFIGPGKLMLDRSSTATGEINPTVVPDDAAYGAAHGGSGATCPEPCLACTTAGPCDCQTSSHAKFCFWGPWFCGTCDMPQHHPYSPPLHGYYYFRPYHPSHLREQQQFVAGWGGDVRNPYDNEIFKTVRAQRSTNDVPRPVVSPKAE